MLGDDQVHGHIMGIAHGQAIDELSRATEPH